MRKIISILVLSMIILSGCQLYQYVEFVNVTPFTFNTMDINFSNSTFSFTNVEPFNKVNIKIPVISNNTFDIIINRFTQSIIPNNSLYNESTFLIKTKNNSNLYIENSPNYNLNTLQTFLYVIVHVFLSMIILTYGSNVLFNRRNSKDIKYDTILSILCTIDGILMSINIMVYLIDLPKINKILITTIPAYGTLLFILIYGLVHKLKNNKKQEENNND